MGYFNNYTVSNSWSGGSWIQNYAVAYAMFQSGDMTLADYTVYYNAFLAYVFGTTTDPYDGLTEKTENFAVWNQVDSIGNYVPASVDPLTGDIIEAYYKVPENTYGNDGRLKVSSNIDWWSYHETTAELDQDGLSYIDNDDVNNILSRFRHTFDFRVGEPGVRISSFPLTFAASTSTLPDNIVYALSHDRMTAAMSDFWLTSTQRPDYGNSVLLVVRNRRLNLLVYPWREDDGSIVAKLIPFDDLYKDIISDVSLYYKFHIEKRDDRLVIYKYRWISTLESVLVGSSRRVRLPLETGSTLVTDQAAYITSNWSKYRIYGTTLPDDVDEFVYGIYPQTGSTNIPFTNLQGLLWLEDVMILTGASLDEMPYHYKTVARNLGTETRTSKPTVNMALGPLKYTEQSTTKTIPLFTRAPGLSKTNTRSLHTISIETLNDDITLFAKAREPINDSIPLYMYASILPVDFVNSALPLYLHKPTISINAWIPLYSSGGAVPVNDNNELFTHDKTGLQDFTTYTLDDGAEVYTDNYSYTQISDNIDDNESAKFYKDMGADYFNERWEVRFQFYIDTDDATGMKFHPFAVSNDVATDSKNWASSLTEVIAVVYEYSTLPSGPHIYLKEYNSATNTGFISLEKQKRYYIKVGRIGSQVTLYVYEDGFLGGTLIDSKNLEIDSSIKHQYGIVADILEADTGDTLNFTLENLQYSAVTIADIIPLYIYGIGTYNDSATLYIKGWADTSNSYIPLQVFGGDPTTFGGAGGAFWNTNSFSLVVWDSQDINKGRTLFIKNTQSSIPFVSDPGLPLFTGGRMYPYSDYIPLFINQEKGVDGQITLVMEGPEKLLPFGSGTSSTLPIYLFRPNETAVIPLVMYNNTPTDNSFIPLYTKGILGNTTDSISLALPNGTIAMNTFTTLFVDGRYFFNDNIPLVMPNVVDIPSANISLVVYHGGALNNSYIPLYVFGAYVHTDTITLAMPDIVEDSIDNIILYTQGY